MCVVCWLTYIDLFIQAYCLMLSNYRNAFLLPYPLPPLISMKKQSGGGESGFPEGGAATCSMWSGYTANNLGFWDHTAVGIVTHSICRCSLKLFRVLVMQYIQRYGRYETTMGDGCRRGMDAGGGCTLSHSKRGSFSQIYIQRV